MKTVNNYLKNVMKSVAYAAADISEEYMPSMHEFTSSNKDFGTATFAALKNPTQAVKRSVKAIQESKIYKALDYGAKNLSEDLRTGNFYNKARKDRDELALSGLDTNWDDLSEFGIDDDWESKLDSSSSNSNSEITAGDLKIVESIEGSNAALANATVNAVIVASQNEIKNSRANTAMLYTQNERLFGGLHKDMTILGSTMQQMYKLQSASLQNIDKNMSTFFTQESKLSTERNAILKEMLELQRNMYKSAADKQKEANSKSKSGRIRWSDISTNGVVNISAYFDAVKKNINNQLASMAPSGFGEDSNMLAEFMVSPLEGAMKYVVNGVIPATVKAAAKELDGTISGVFGNIIGELGNARSKNEGGLLGTIAKFLGISTSVNRNIDTSRYEKGPIPFDGITRKAIIDVIPTHLRRIEAAITGRPEEMFDYKAGRWVKVSTVKKQFEDIKKNAIKRATSELREAMNPGIQAVRKGMDNKSDRDTFDKAVEEFQEFLYNNNGRFNPKVSASKNGINAGDYPNLYRNYNKIRTIFSDFDKIESKDRNGNKTTRNVKNRIRMQLSNSVLDTKEYEEKQYRDIESDIGNIFQMYFGAPKADTHGKYKSNGKFESYNILNNTKDNLGNTIFDYLQNINKELTWFRMNGIPGGGRSKGGYGRNSANVSMDEIQKQLDKSNPNTNNYGNQFSENERIRKSALEAIASGKAVDLRDFDIDEQAYLLQLSSMMSNNAISEYKSEIKGYNNNAISNFMDKHFIKTNIKSLKDVDEAIKKADKEGKNTNEVNMDAKEEKFFKKILNRIGAGESILGGIVGASSEAFTNLLYTTDKAIYEMMYKTEISDENKTKYNGFMNMMAGKMTDTFKSIRDKFKENIIDPFLERFGINEKFKKDFKDSFINTGSRLWTAFKDANKSVYGPLLDKIRPDVDYYELEMQKIEAEKQERKEALKHRRSTVKDFKNKYQSTSKITNKNFSRAIKFGTKDWANDSAFGLDKSEEAKEARIVRMAAINEGGEVLEYWCEQNGFTGSLDEKKVRLGSEFGIPAAGLAKIKTDEDANRVFAKQFRHHAKGTPSGRPFTGLTTLTKGEGLISGRGVSVVPKTGVYNVTSPTHIINRKDMAGLGGRNLSNASIQNDLGKEKLAAKSAGFNVATHGDGTVKITNNGVDINKEEFLSEAKKFIPEAASGGLIGGILSLVLGLAGGPLLGAAIGAGGSIIAKSDMLKDKLFGKAGEDGKRDGSGIISKTVMNTFNKYFPDMAKYGLAGIIPGLLTPLGPIGGLMVGGAFGYLKNNENFTNKYFGEGGKLTLKSKEKKILEKMIPGAAKGAVAGAIATLFLPTPFGILGNAAMGAGLGMMASTEEFKDFILGKEINGERMGGLAGAFKDAFKPFTDALKNAGDKLKDAFEENVIDPLARFIKPAIHALPIALGAPFRKLSDMLEKSTKGIGKTLATRIKTSRIGKGAGKLVGIGASGIKWLTSWPGRFVGGVGDRLREYDIAHNDTVDMNQQEAVAWMDNVRHKGDKVSSLLRKSASITDKDQAIQLRDVLFRMNDTQKLAERNLKNKNDELNKLLTNYRTKNPDGSPGKGLSRTQINKILEHANKGDFGAISDILQNRTLEGSNVGMTKAEFNSFMDEGGLKKAVSQAVEAKTRLENINNISKDQASSDAKKALEKLGFSSEETEKLLTNKNYRADFAKLLSDRSIELEANPVDYQTRLENENNENIKTSTQTLQGILELMKTWADPTSKPEDIQNTVNNIDKKLNIGQNNANNRYDKNQQKAEDKMSEEERAKLHDGNHDKAIDNLTVKKNRNMGAKYGADILNNVGSDMRKVKKALRRTRNPFKRIKMKDGLIKYCTQEAAVVIDKLSNYEVSVLSKSFKNKFIYDAIIKGGYTITPKTIKLLTSSVNAKKLAINCLFLSQIYNKPEGKDIYKEYDSLEDISNISLQDIYDLEVQYDIKYTDKTSSISTNINRKIKTGVSWIKDKSKLAAGGLMKGIGFLGSLPFKGIGAGTNKISDIGIHSDEWHETHNTSDTTQNAFGTISQHGIGSLLLGAGKAIVGGAGKLIGKAGKAVASLFKRKKNKSDGTDSENAGLLGGLFGNNKPIAINASASNLDEVNKKGDNRSVIQMGEYNKDLVYAKRDSSDNIELDTTDSHTKTVMNKLSLKEKALEKLQAAQLKASELIKTTFDTSGVKESKGGKLGWFSLLLGGAVLWKSGILKKLFDGVIKPLWTDNIKPWITDKAIPWIKDTAIPAIGDLFSKGINTLLEKLPYLLGEAVGMLIQNLPKVIWNGIKGIFNFGAGIVDTLTGNVTNVGAVTTVDPDQLVKDYGADYVTEMYDENGNALTAGDLANGNYGTVYNQQGAAGALNSNGKIDFEDQSVRGSSYAKVVGNGAVHAFAKSAATGKNSLMVKGASKASDILMHPGSYFKRLPGISKIADTKTGKVLGKIASKLTKGPRLLSKIGGAAGKVITAPLKAAENLGIKYNNWVNKVVDSTSTKILNSTVSEAVGETTENIVKETLEASVDTTIDKTIKETTEKVAKETTEEIIDKTAKSALSSVDDVAKASSKNGGFLSKLLAKAKEAISGLFENSTVKSKLAGVAKSLGETNVGKWISKFKNFIDNIFSEAMEKGVKKVGSETCKKVLSKVFAIAFVIIDFITGCDQAESILGVLETSLVEELVAGLLNALCNFLIIPSIFPGTNWIARKIFEFFTDDFEERQAEATAAYEKYKEETGSTLTQEEWQARESSVTGKIGGAISDAWNGLLKGAKNFGGWIYDKVHGVTEEKSVSKSDEALNTNVSTDKLKSGRRTASNASGTISLSNLRDNTNSTAAFVSNLTNNLKSDIGDLADKDIKFNDTNKIMDKVKDGRISIFSKDYWKLSNESDGTLKSSLNSAYSMLTRIINLPMLMVKDALNSLVSDTEEIGGALTGNNTTSTTSSVTTASTKTTIGSKIKNLLATAADKIKSFFGFGTGTYRYGTGGYSKQIDPSIANIRFNSSSDSEYQTIGDSGCGPAAAVNAMESMYGRGNAVASAAKFAVNHGYKETNGGTKPGFFADYFGRNGFNSQTTFNKSAIARNINNGMPTVIMGSDARGTSSSTPFGRTPHYVTVTGVDGRGNAIVQDPESRYDNQLYPLKNLMNNTSFGVSAFGKNYKHRRFGRGKYGRGTNDEEYIWWYLKQMGMTDAGAAGLMGNLEAESDLRSNLAEKAVLNYTRMTTEEYTAAVDNGSINKETFLHPKGGTSKYGYGLAQWTSIGRKEGLYNLVKQRGVSISDLRTQLDWLAHEFNTDYKTVYNILKTTNSLAEASDAVLTKFERPADQSDANKLKRQEKGKKYLNKYGNTSGSSEYTPAINAYASNNNYNGTYTTNGTINTSISGINNAISKISEVYGEYLSTSKVGDVFSLFKNKLSSIFSGTDESETTDSEVESGIDLTRNTNDNSNGHNQGGDGMSLGDMSNAAKDYADKMVKIANNELKLGIKETPLGSDNVKYNDWYWGADNKSKKQPWCAAFVSWVANQAGVPTSVIPRYAYTPNGYDILRQNGGEVDKTKARAGDILFTYNPDKGRIGHTGIVTGRSGDNIISIEGNYSDKVSEVTRGPSKNANEYNNYLHITRPNYGSGSGGNGIKPLSKYGQFRNSINNRSKANSNYSSLKTSTNNRRSNNNAGMGTISYGMAGSPDYSKLINAIINILMTIADNTDKLNLIVSILNNKLNLNISASDVSNATTGNETLKSKLSSALNGINSRTSKFNTYADNIGDNSINSIISAMNAIASE